MRAVTISVLICALFMAVHAGRDGKCRAIVMSGGGDKGSYEASALSTLIRELPQIETEYDVVSGVSAGSLNGILFHGVPIGEEDKFIDFSLTEWRKFVPSDAFVLWPGGIKEGIVEHGALFDDTPMFTWLPSVVEGLKAERHYIAGSADMVTGTFVTYDHPATGELIDQYTVESAIASSSMPGIFEYIERDGYLLLDGGVVWRTDAYSAIDYCRDEGYADSDIIVDWIQTKYAHKEDPEDIETWHTWSHGMRALSIQSYYKAMTDWHRKSHSTLRSTSDT